MRLRGDDGWRDVTIGNVSSRGLMLRGLALPPKGGFVEVRHRSVCIIGRVVWSHGARCGVRTQDAVDISALLSHAPTQPKFQTERRHVPRSARPAQATPRIAETVQASRRFARMFDWCMVVAGGAIAAVALANAASVVLAQPLDRARGALQKEPLDERG